MPETPLQMEERHVAESLVRLARQRELVARLVGQSSALVQSARAFLSEMEAFHEQALAGLEIERAKSGGIEIERQERPMAD